MKKLHFTFFILMFSVTMVTLPAFAQETVGVSIPAGTDTPGCEETDLCYIPSPLTVTVGTTVQWTNQDTAAHTVTSGSPEEGPNGIIYSDLMSAGEVFAFQFDEPGSYPYFCMVHPWMEGLVIAQVSDTPLESGDFALKEIMATNDGNVVIIQSDVPKAGEELALEVSFVDENGNLLESMNYDIRIIQDNEDVLFLQNENSHDGEREHFTRTLESDNPVDVEIGIRGIYPASDNPQPVEEVIEFQQIPEFGEITILILVASISALIALRIKPIMAIPNQ